MTLGAPPVLSNDISQNSIQFVPIRLAQIRSFALEYAVNRKIGTSSPE
jgi:hypothetical protein